MTLVQEAEERRSWGDNLSANNLQPTDALGFHYVKAGDKESSAFSSDDGHETADGMLARLFYSYDDRYMFTGSIRRDGYSALVLPIRVQLSIQPPSDGLSQMRNFQLGTDEFR